MGRGLSYADAVVLLGGQRSRTVEALDGPAVPFDAAELGLTDADRVAIAGVEGGGAPAVMSGMLLRTAVPMLEPHRPYERNLAALTEFYTNASGRLLHLITGLAVWDRLDERWRGGCACSGSGCACSGSG